MTITLHRHLFHSAVISTIAELESRDCSDQIQYLHYEDIAASKFIYYSRGKSILGDFQIVLCFFIVYIIVFKEVFSYQRKKVGSEQLSLILTYSIQHPVMG